MLCVTLAKPLLMVDSICFGKRKICDSLTFHHIVLRQMKKPQSKIVKARIVTNY